MSQPQEGTSDLRLVPALVAVVVGVVVWLLP